MIKRIIATLTICLIITGLISPVFSDASALPQPNWSDPGISEIINISDLTGWMLNGGTYDVSRYTDAESFMNDYFNARTKTRLVSPGEAVEDYYEVLPGFGINNQLVSGESFANPLDTNRVIASSFRDHTGYGRRLSNEVNNAILSNGSLSNTKIPLLNDIEFANFVGYNHSALDLYKDYFITDGLTISPDINYNSYIDAINGSGFWWNSYSNLNYYESGPGLLIYPPNTLSWFSYGNNKLIDSSHTATVNCSHYLNLYINKETDNSYSFDLTIPVSDRLFNFIYRNISYRQGEIRSNGKFAFLSAVNNNDFIYHVNGTLTEVFNYIKSYFRNVNIYVDGTPWSIVGNATKPIITPEFPDAVGGEDLPSTTWPVHRPLAPYFITAPGMLKAIQDAIDDDGKLDIDDLKPYLTDENGDPVTDPQFDPEPVPIPVPDPVNPDVVPGLPVLPVMPPELPSFNGVSVLAEIINFTNQSLPTSLIVTFWGVVFGIVILGLIKILHK